MTKNTLLAIAAFAASIAVTAKTLAGEAPEGDPAEIPAPEEKPPRRGRGPAKQPEAPAAATLTETKLALAGKTLEELQALIKVPVEGGKGQKVKDFLAAHGATKLADLAPEHHAALAAEMKRLTLEVEAEQM